MTPAPPPIAQTLPKQARDRLVEASKVQDPKQRRIAIDAAIEALRLLFPQHFHHHKEN